MQITKPENEKTRVLKISKYSQLAPNLELFHL